MSEFYAASFLPLSGKLWPWLVSAATSFLARSLNFASVSHTWELDAASFWSEPPATVFPARCAVRLESCWLGALSILGRFDAPELGAEGELAAERETWFNVGFDFATILSSPVPCCILFDIASGQLAELKTLMLNRWRRLFHLSRVKLSFVSMSASCFLVSTYLIWIFGSRLNLSNDQSSATLWVLETCLIVGLLPFMIILISLLHYPQKCRGSHQIEKTSRLKKHNRRCIMQDHCDELES